MTSPTELLTAAQVAEAAGVSLTTVKRKALKDKLPYAVKLPGKTGAYLFHAEAVDVLRGAA